MNKVETKTMRGGAFLVTPTSEMSTFIPEQFSEEHKMMADMGKEFLNTEVFPILDRIDNMEEGLMASLIDKAGQLGLLSLSIPESYEGLGKDFITGTLITEVLGAGHSFAVAMAAHTGIGTLPILYFGNEDQKKKYLPKLSSGELKASYCLTEPGSGSDALAAKTKAVLSADKKHYIINGQKMWITNAGFADVFIVFAKIDGEKFTGFIIEKEYPGISLGNEEHKMGIKGSSTRQVFFNDCKVPVENVLGEIGKGHLIAFNILNIGRLKLAAAALGGCKRSAGLSVEYANTREQFNMSLGKFGAIKHKLAEQAIRTFALETTLYRLAHMIDEDEKLKQSEGMSYEKSLLSAAEEYAAECAMIKVFGSEVLDFVVDEGVQIYGGYGYSTDYPMDRSYRDSRINRIFEGTNEINRLLTVDMLVKRAMKGELDLMTAASNVQKELMSIPEFGNGSDDPMLLLENNINAFKKAALMVAGFAAQKYMMKLVTEQEIIMNITDMLIDIFVAESIYLRVNKLSGSIDEKKLSVYHDMLNVYVQSASDRINLAGKAAIGAMAEGDELRMLQMGLKRFTKVQNYNSKEARRRIARHMLEANSYCF
ncbi:MAG TPA: acyl-CoA dehydrogenase family protein [Bacteroidia bacterium]|nr:acyl-CoA dehydrogenase family protein [Bacteroidia bacterium]HNT79185.1 acyl-CoA dehydrogenase family protein [Bacteroidia bacterium]